MLLGSGVCCRENKVVEDKPKDESDHHFDMFGSSNHFAFLSSIRGLPASTTSLGFATIFSTVAPSAEGSALTGNLQFHCFQYRHDLLGLDLVTFFDFDLPHIGVERGFNSDDIRVVHELADGVH